MEKKHIFSVIYGIAIFALFVTLISILGDAMNWDYHMEFNGSVDEETATLLAGREYRVFGFGIGAVILCVAFLLTKKWKYVHLGLGVLSLAALIISFSFILHYGIYLQYQLGEYVYVSKYGEYTWIIREADFVVLTAFRATLYPILAELIVLFGIGIGAFVSPVRAVIANFRARKNASAAYASGGIASLPVEAKDASEGQMVLSGVTAEAKKE